MSRRWILIVLINIAFLFQASAQSNSRQKEQFQIDEQLASEYYRQQDYENARDIYARLFEKSGQGGHFQQYVECLLQLKEYDKAEKELKSFAKKRPNYHKAVTDLVYVYTLQGQPDKARKQFNDILKNLPDNASVIRNYAYNLQVRNLNDMAMEVLEKGNTLLNGKETLYLDMANISQSSANYKEAFHYFLLDLELHPEQYSNVRNRLQTMLFYDVNNSISDELRFALLEHTQAKPDNLEFAQLLVWFALQQEDYDIALAQCQSIDRKTHNQDAQIINLAGICLNNKQYDIAHDGYKYLVDKGKSNPYYGQAVTGIINTEYQKLLSENKAEAKPFERLSRRIDEAYNEISTNDLAKLTLIQADIMAYHLVQAEEAIALLQNAINAVTDKQGQAQLKLKLADIYLNQDEVWEATLLYSQVDKSMKEEPLGHEARFKNAQLRYFIGEYEWAESQLKVLKAATSKLIANDAMTLSLVIKDNLEVDTTGMELNRLARADYRIYQQRDEEAAALLDDIITNGNEISVPHALFRKGGIAEKHKDFEGAEQLYLQIVTHYPGSYMADAALMQAALIEQNHLKNKELAKQHYEQLIDEYPTSIYTAQAKKNYRKL